MLEGEPLLSDLMLAIRYGLRGDDSVQLATAPAAQDALSGSEPVTFGDSDLRSCKPRPRLG